jgi:class 3 adenylate cyclase/ABC-type nitrate/sulfonate/bicarbonate transport system substrate-binding protein
MEESVERGEGMRMSVALVREAHAALHQCTRAVVRLPRILVTLFALPLLTGPAFALDHVSLQLKWRHQFQFAGYYAALAKGFYREAGLDVQIREGGPDTNVPALVSEGKADFGVCTSSTLIAKAKGLDLVVLGVIFQHSAAALLVPRRTGIGTLSELQGHRLMDAPDSDDVAAMLKREGVDYAKLPRVAHNGDPQDLADGKADAMVGYSANEPFVLDQLGVPYELFAPRAFGFDFYGDSLCTSTREVKAHPQQVRAFLVASLKGWDYALSHKEEIADLIRDRYSTRKSRDALLFEARRIQALVHPQLIPLGTQNRQHWQHIADTYRDLGMLRDSKLPDDLFYRLNDSESVDWLNLGLIGLLLLALGCIAGLLWITLHERRRTSAFGALKLSAVMSAVFVCLSIPILIFILLYNYQRTSAAIVSTLTEDVAKANQASIENTQILLQPVAGTLRLLAAMAAADPAFFRTDASADLLYRALTSAEQIDAVYVSFEDGYHRVVTRIDDDRRRSDPRIPSSANWHSSYIDDFSAGTDRARHRTFSDTWPHVVGQYSVASSLDVRTTPGYAAARDSGGLVVTDPSINPDTGYPIVYVRYPIVRDGVFIGVASANITLDVLSRFLASHRVSPHSVTIIADAADGKIVAAPVREDAVRLVDGKLEIATLDSIPAPDLHAAYREHVETHQDQFVFRSPVNGDEVSASFMRFPGHFHQRWQVITVTPTDDFVGGLKATNRQMVAVIVVLTAIEFLLIYFLCTRLARPIESVSEDLKSVETLSFGGASTRRSQIKEIAQLQSAAALLRNSLQSFSSFVPLDVVRELVKSGHQLTLGVEPRRLTVFFSDLENFSTHAERMAPNELLDQMSVYFEQVSQAISQEQGTVDKFIGDGVMAFWGAPAPRPDHARRACAGAMRAARRMERTNAAWQAEGRAPLRIRIGLHSADVLVGNVGSSERLSYTVMGDGVNVAARLEGINKLFGTTICISDSVCEAAGSDILVRPLRTVQVKGRTNKFMIYQLLGFAGSDDPELAARDEEVRLAALTREASDAFERGDRAEAARRYRKILDAFPSDPVAAALLAACRAEAQTIDA